MMSGLVGSGTTATKVARKLGFLPYSTHGSGKSIKGSWFGGIDSSHPHDCWRKGRRPKWDGLFTTIISPIPDKISCNFFSNFRRWISNPGALRKFMMKSFTHPNLWHGPRILTCAKNIKQNTVTGMLLCTNKDNTKRTTAIHPPSTNNITQPCDLVFSAKQLLQTSRRNLLISPHAQVQVRGSDADIGSRGTFPWETARSWGLEV